MCRFADQSKFFNALTHSLEKLTVISTTYPALKCLTHFIIGWFQLTKITHDYKFKIHTFRSQHRCQS